MTDTEKLAAIAKRLRKVVVDTEYAMAWNDPEENSLNDDEIYEYACNVGMNNLAHDILEVIDNG